jgi:hypothetical protein
MLANGHDQLQFEPGQERSSPSLDVSAHRGKTLIFNEGSVLRLFTQEHAEPAPCRSLAL